MMRLDGAYLDGCNSNSAPFSRFIVPSPLHQCRTTRPTTTPTTVDRYVVNKCSWSLPFCPPIGALLVCVVLITAILPLLVMNNDLALNSNRAGFLTIALVPFLLASTGRYSALALLTGMSATRLNFLHRVLGLAIVLLATVHMACMVVSWAPFPSFMASQLQVLKVKYGLAGYGCLCVVVLGSLYPIRVFKYEIFVCTHLLAFGFIGAISKHTPYAMRYFITGIICYCLNLLASWFVQARLARARAHVLPNDCTRLSLRLSSPMNHHPGQYIYLCIPRLSPFQWHPFTITNTQPLGEGFCDTLVEVHASVRGNYTRQLYSLAGTEDDWTAFVSGPCGRTLPSTSPQAMLAEQRVIVTATAGAGVTFGIRLIRELVDTLFQAKDEDSSEEHQAKPLPHRIVTRDIYFMWSVRQAGAFQWFDAELHSYKAQFDRIHASDPHFPRLHIMLYHTGADDAALETNGGSSRGDQNNSQETSVDETCDELVNEKNVLHLAKETAPTHSFTCRQRMNPRDCLALTSDAESMGLFVCGPASFNRSFKNAVASLNASRSCLLDFHCEDFEY
ncbi:hypothetical protein [Absidia glauca]|uniref:ferric-chelate reductase (NADPH) n=1 Tax=Absidia glauca TaxID=4829 RepID=A0A168QQE6_ABSGL|nr:hypothetical protein [Absidia glauca]